MSEIPRHPSELELPGRLTIKNAANSNYYFGHHLSIIRITDCKITTIKTCCAVSLSCDVVFTFTTLHYYTTLHHTTLHYTTLHYTTLHYTALHCTALHYTARHNTTPQYTTLHYTTLHYTTLHYTTLHYTTL